MEIKTGNFLWVLVAPLHIVYIAQWCPEIYDITFNVELEKDVMEVTLI